MKQLSNKYGKQKPFKDDLLFDEIISLTYPSVKLFLKIMFKEIFQLIIMIFLKKLV